MTTLVTVIPTDKVRHRKVISRPWLFQLSFFPASFCLDFIGTRIPDACGAQLARTRPRVTYMLNKCPIAEPPPSSGFFSCWSFSHLWRVGVRSACASAHVCRAEDNPQGLFSPSTTQDQGSQAGLGGECLYLLVISLAHGLCFPTRKGWVRVDGLQLPLSPLRS